MNKTESAVLTLIRSLAIRNAFNCVTRCVDDSRMRQQDEDEQPKSTWNPFQLLWTDYGAI